MVGCRNELPCVDEYEPAVGGASERDDADSEGERRCSSQRRSGKHTPSQPQKLGPEPNQHSSRPQAEHQRASLISLTRVGSELNVALQVSPLRGASHDALVMVPVVTRLVEDFRSEVLGTVSGVSGGAG